MNSLSVVLVEPQGDANMGAAARAMKNCGVSRLVLVNPARFDTPWGKGMACQAVDLLMEARIESSLDAAIGDAQCAVGFTARTGRHRKPLDEYDAAVTRIVDRLSHGSVALVFGREDDGLSNEELDRCDFTVAIPTSANYSSLNLAQAVLIACHDIFMRVHREPIEMCESFVGRKDYEHILYRWNEILSGLGYEDELRESILSRWRDLFGRAGLSTADVKMFEGLLSRFI